MGPEGAINIVFREALQKAADPAKARDEMIANYRQTFANPFKAAESGYIDAVIYPEDTRPTLIRSLGNVEKQARSQSAEEAWQYSALKKASGMRQ